MLYPFMPQTAAVALKQLNVELRDYNKLGEFGLYPDGNKVTENPETLFARLDANEVNKKAEEIAAKYAKKEEKKAEKVEEKAEIGIEDFAKISLRVAQVTACERVEKSDKLLKLTLSLGDEQRTVASGIAKYYTPEQMVGKKVILVANLKPAMLRGVKSEGMILCAEKDGVVTLVEPAPEMPVGSVVR